MKLTESDEIIKRQTKNINSLVSAAQKLKDKLNNKDGSLNDQIETMKIQHLTDIKIIET